MIIRKLRAFKDSHLTEAHVAGIKRGSRYFGYNMLGIAAANAAALTAYVLLHFHASVEMITLGGFIATSIASGAKRTYSYVKTGTPPQDDPGTPTLQAPTVISTPAG